MSDCDKNLDDADLTATCEEQRIEFQWRKTEGMKRYTIKLRHVKSRKHLILEASVYKNSYKCRIEDDIRYGQVYEMMVEFVGPNNEIRRTSGWKEFILGAEKVPVYPSARLNLENPQRSMIVTWQKCQIKPKLYLVKSIPCVGRIKTYTCSGCAMTIRQLKSNTEYTFEVQALFEDDSEGPACQTDKLSTLAKPGSYLTTQNYSGITGSTFHIKNPTSVQNSHITKVTDPDFGKARNVEMITRADNGVEMAMVQWEEPLFHGERDDYEILQYKVTVMEGQNKIRDWICQETDQAEEVMINLGQFYVVSIETKFQEIDTEKLHCAYCKDEFYSRPTVPKIKVTEYPNSVLVEWICERGAEEYLLEVYESDSLVFNWEGNKSFRDKEIDKKKLNLGRSYKFCVVAFAKGKKSNDDSVTRIFGGDHVVRNAHACLNKDRPRDSVDISWESPERPEVFPKEYQIREVNVQGESIVTKDTRCTVPHLRPGIRYQFEVISVYDDHDGHPAKTNWITTDPRPERIFKVDWKLDDRCPDSCLHLSWTQSELATKHKIRAICSDTVREHDVTGKEFVLSGLKPNTSYKIYVSAGNDEGFGAECAVDASTEIKVPFDVRLTWNAGQFLQATCCGGEHGETFWNLYKSDGNLLVESDSSKLLLHEFKTYEGNTEYYATVQFTKRGKNIRSNTLLTVPSQVRDMHASRGSDSPSTDVHLEWTPIEGLNYELEFKTDHYVEAIIRSTGMGKCDYRCLQEGNEYSVRIRAQNATGYGKWSQKEYVSLVLPRVKNLRYVIHKSSLTIHWEGPRTEHLRATISHYILKVFSGDNYELYTREIKETTAEITPLVPGETYKFSVAAVDGSNVAGEDESGCVTMGHDSPEVTKIDQVNDPQSKFMVHLNKRGCRYDKIIITASSDNGTPKEYEHVVTSQNNIMEIIDLVPGHNYSLYVEAVFGSHRRPKELIGTYELRPSVVQQLEAQCTGRNTVTLKWLPHEDHNTKYLVHWKKQSNDSFNTIKCDVAEARITDLQIGVNYEGAVCAYIGECYGPEAKVTCTTGWSGDEIFEILVEKSSKESKISVPLLPISFDVDGVGNVSLSDLVEKYQKKKILILGEEISGKSTICTEICKEIGRTKTKQTLPIVLSSRDIYAKSNLEDLLNRQWDWDLTEFEQNLFKSWMQSHGEEVTYVIDDTLGGFARIANMQQFLTLVSQSTVFLVGSKFNDHFVTMTHYIKCSLHIDYSADQVSQHLSLFGPEKAEAWNEIRQRQSDLCFSPKHFFAVIDFVKNENSETRFSSPAWVYAKVYQTLNQLSYQSSYTEHAAIIIQEKKKIFVLNVKQPSRLSDLVEFSFKVCNLTPPVTPDEKFKLALQVVYFSPPQALLSLLQNCDDENILLLCADCIHASNRIEIFKLFLREEWEDANFKLEKNISALKNADPSFTPKLGKKFRDTFISAAGIRETT